MRYQAALRPDMLFRPSLCERAIVLLDRLTEARWHFIRPREREGIAAGLDLLPQVEFKLLQPLERRRLELGERVRIVVDAGLLPLCEAAHDGVEIRRVHAGRQKLL